MSFTVYLVDSVRVPSMVGGVRVIHTLLGRLRKSTFNGCWCTCHSQSTWSTQKEYLQWLLVYVSFTLYLVDSERVPSMVGGVRLIHSLLGRLRKSTFNGCWCTSHSHSTWSTQKEYLQWLVVYESFTLYLVDSERVPSMVGGVRVIHSLLGRLRKSTFNG